MSNIEYLTRYYAQQFNLNIMDIEPMLSDYGPIYDPHYGMCYGSEFWTTQGSLYRVLFLHRPDDPSQHKRMIYFSEQQSL